MSTDSQYTLYQQSIEPESYSYLPEIETAVNQGPRIYYHRRANSHPNPAPFNEYCQPSQHVRGYGLQEQLHSQHYSTLTGAIPVNQRFELEGKVSNVEDRESRSPHQVVDGTSTLIANTSSATDFAKVINLTMLKRRFIDDSKQMQNFYGAILDGARRFVSEPTYADSQPSLAMIDDWIRNATRAFQLMPSPRNGIARSASRYNSSGSQSVDGQDDEVRTSAIIWDVS